MTTQQLSPSNPFAALLAAAQLPLASLDGTEMIGPILKANGSNPAGNRFYRTTVAELAAAVNKGGAVVTVLANTSGNTLSAAALQPGNAGEVFVKMTGTLTAGAALTLPTVAALVASLGVNFVVGMSWKFRLQNAGSGAFAWTLTTAAGWSAIANGAVSQNTWRDFVFTLTSATAGTIVDVGSGVSP